MDWPMAVPSQNHFISHVIKIQNDFTFSYWLDHIVQEKRPLNRCFLSVVQLSLLAGFVCSLVTADGCRSQRATGNSGGPHWCYLGLVDAQLQNAPALMFVWCNSSAVESKCQVSTAKHLQDWHWYLLFVYLLCICSQIAVTKRYRCCCCSVFFLYEQS